MKAGYYFDTDVLSYSADAENLTIVHDVTAEPGEVYHYETPIALDKIVSYEEV
jgi:hypothetical protein